MCLSLSSKRKKFENLRIIAVVFWGLLVVISFRDPFFTMTPPKKSNQHVALLLVVELLGHGWNLCYDSRCEWFCWFDWRICGMMEGWLVDYLDGHIHGWKSGDRLLWRWGWGASNRTSKICLQRFSGQWRNERETFHGTAQMMIKNWVLKGLNNAFFFPHAFLPR